jgi:hypothetical protein
LVPDSTRDGFNTRNQDLNVARNEKRELALKAGEEARMALFRITLELGEEKEHYTAEEVATQCRLLKEYAVWKVKKAEADREAWALMTDDERGRYEEEEEVPVFPAEAEVPDIPDDGFCAEDVDGDEWVYDAEDDKWSRA